MTKCFNWINLRPTFSIENFREKAIISELFYMVRENKTNYINLNEKGLN